VFLYLYAQTAQKIYQLKAEALKTVVEEKWVRAEPLPQSPGYWTCKKVNVERVVAHMSPRDARWQDYRNAKRRATLLLAARLILKANNGNVPEKREMSPLISMGIVRSHARMATAQKALALAAYRYLRKLDNRLRKQPDRFVEVGAWFKER
jgi:hypothetical protein